MSKQQGEAPHPLQLWRILGATAGRPLAAIGRKAGSCGERYFGVHAGLAVPLILFFAGYAPTVADRQVMYGFLAVYLGFYAWHRVAGKRLRARGYRCHSQDMGVSRLTLRTEPLVWFGLGVVLHPLTPPLGVYLLLGAAGLWYELFETERRLKAVARAQRDAMFEQRWVASHLGDE